MKNRRLKGRNGRREINLRSLTIKPRILSDKIYYYRNVINNPEKIIDLIEGSETSIMISKWREWNSSSNDYSFGETKTIDHQQYNNSPKKEKTIYDELISAFKIVAFDYSNSEDIYLRKTNVCSISKYSEGKFMGPHTDEKSGAYISAVGYLNDDYSGGEIGFPNQNISIKPEAGSIIIFPSTDPFIHDPQPAYGSERYICPVFWYRNVL